MWCKLKKKVRGKISDKLNCKLGYKMSDKLRWKYGGRKGRRNHEWEERVCEYRVTKKV